MKTLTTPDSIQTLAPMRYTDSELQEFLSVIQGKLNRARQEFAGIISMLMDADNGDRSAAKGMMEANVEFNEREELAGVAQRLEKFIGQLEAAEHRVRTKTYGVCIVTGKLIPKERLLLVPHTTQCVEAKEGSARMRA
ncbi:MAG: TraR/DksA C4-type zinc finger protein [Flavobacteriales bacterium]